MEILECLLELTTYPNETQVVIQTNIPTLTEDYCETEYLIRMNENKTFIVTDSTGDAVTFEKWQDVKTFVDALCNCLKSQPDIYVDSI
jgi:hypothetical protein